jgi:hypothetical protein
VRLKLIKAQVPGYPGIFFQALDLALQAHLSNQILTVTTITKAQNKAPQSQTLTMPSCFCIFKNLSFPYSYCGKHPFYPLTVGICS